MNKIKAIRVQMIVILLILATFLANFLVPSMVKVKMAENVTDFANSGLSRGVLNKELVLKASYKEHMFSPRVEPKPDNRVTAVITAYTSTVDQCDDTPFIGASGKHVYDGMIAANWLPFGTKIKIPALYGDKIFTVDDRMNKRYGHGRMDIWLDTSKTQARIFGVKRVEVEIYYPKTDIRHLAKL